MHKYCGKIWSEEDIRSIRELIEAHPKTDRTKLSRLVCELFNWRKPDGKVKEMSCRVVMLKMHRSGLIKLPEPKRLPPSPYQLVISEEGNPAPDFYGNVHELENLTVELVPRGKTMQLWNQFVARYHYLGYKMLPGAQLRYFIKDGERILGAMGFGSAAWKVAPRDTFIGWNTETRVERLHLIVNQSRFLILPWIHCKNLASKSLAVVRRRLPDDWEKVYNYRPILMETFVENERFHGTCYKADGWYMVGNTQGRGKNDRLKAYNQPIKSIWLKPLSADFRQNLNKPME